MFIDIIALVIAILWGGIYFIGLNFLDFEVSFNNFLLGMGAPLLLWFFGFKAKTKKGTHHNFEINIVKEIVYIVLFAGMVVFMLFFSSSLHFFNVEHRKTDINKEMEVYIATVDNLFPTYDNYATTRIEKYKQDLEVAIKSKDIDTKNYNTKDFVSSLDDQKNIEIKVLHLKEMLFPKEYDSLKNVFNKTVDEIRNIKFYNIRSLVYMPNFIKENEYQCDKMLTYLKDISGRSRKGEENFEEFEYEINKHSVERYFTDNTRNYAWWIYLFAGIACFMMFLPYMLTNRSSKLYKN